MGAYAKIVSGEALKGELTVYESRGAHPQIRVKLVGWFPRRLDTARKGTVIVKTDAESFLVCLTEQNKRLWVINGNPMVLAASGLRAQGVLTSEDPGRKVKRPRGDRFRESDR